MSDARQIHAPMPFTVPIAGMHCASCVGRVERALRGLPGVKEAGVNLATGRASLRYEGQPDAAGVVRAITAAGFTVPETSVEIGVDGLTCASCVSRVERALARVPGVTAASVNLASGRATVRLAAGSATEQDLRAAVEASGYATRPTDAATADHETVARRTEAEVLQRDLIVAALLTLPLVLLAMGDHLVPALHRLVDDTIGVRADWAVQAVLAGLVLAGPGRRFLGSGFPALWRGHPDMNALVALGTTAAFCYSLLATLLPEALPAGTAAVYFESAALIVVLVLAGRSLEARARGRTGDAIRRLLELAPKTARVVHDGQESAVEIGVLRVGDIVRVRPGETVAVDGIVTVGQSYVNEAMLTGEPAPTLKAPGAQVVGGTTNTTGSFDLRVTGVGAETVLARIVRMVEEAQGAKLPIQAMVDRVTAWFVPAVIAAAAATFLLWLAFGPAPSLSLALVNAVSVLIIACPCAMGLATPTSIMVGTGRAAQMGILFRHGDSLQVLQQVATVAFDKTGTLTEGRPVLTDLRPGPGFGRDELLGLMAAVEARSEHPIAAAVVAAAGALPRRSAEAFEAVPGQGAAARVDGRLVQIGADRYMASLGIEVAGAAEDAAHWAAGGATLLYVAVDRRFAGLAAVSDPVRPGAAAAITALRALGLRVAMLTGDNAATAAAVARRLGIDEVAAELLPAGKVTALRQLRGDGRIAFVGDGINDAPTLAEADVGLAVATGTDIAVESADVVLMSGDLVTVVKAIALSRATMRNIRQNLFWAFAYNVALIPVAAGALYALNGPLLSPVLAAGAMALSSVFVLANALRLARFGSTAPRPAQALGAVPAE